MNHNINKSFLAVLIAMALLFGPWHSNGGTNEAGKQTITGAGNAAIKRPNWAVVEGQFEGAKDTNGWSCMLQISNQPWLSDQCPPVCQLSAQNITTNTLTFFWGGVYGCAYSRIELLDSKGQRVGCTAKGQQIATRTSEAQIREMVRNCFKEWVHERARTDSFIRVRPGRSVGIGFSVPELFEISQPGEYTLKAELCLIQRVGGEDYDPQLKITRLPEVTAKLQIRSGNIAK